jgi:hypothetical protein
MNEICAIQFVPGTFDQSCSARNLVRDITGDNAAAADAGQEEAPPAVKVDVSSAATRMFALLFLVKGIECCATSKVQGEHALAEVTKPLE